MTMGYEGGEYSNFRHDITALSETISNEFIYPEDTVTDLASNDLFINTSFTSEVILKLNDIDIGCWHTIGVGNQILTASFGLFFTKNKITGLLNTNFTIHGQYISTGISYRIN